MNARAPTPPARSPKPAAPRAAKGRAAAGAARAGPARTGSGAGASGTAVGLGAPTRAPRARAARSADTDGRPGVADTGTPSARRSEAMVREALLKALLGGALRPGTPLRERHLAQAFGATRGTVRKVLLRLGAEGKLELRPHRGAFVPTPTAEDVRRVYEMRRVVECGTVAVLAEGLARDRLAPLDALVLRERQAQRAGRRDEAVRLAGDFHLVLADLLGNAELSASLRALVARTQLFVALFESADDAAGCSVDEHDAVVRALRRRDGPAAVRAVSEHLHHVERRVLARMPRPRNDDVGAILRAAME